MVSLKLLALHWHGSRATSAIVLNLCCSEGTLQLQCHAHQAYHKGPYLAPFCFLPSAYTSPIGDLICSFGIHNHQFPDDTQVHLALRSSDILNGFTLLADCTAAVKQWYLVNGLLLNASKSEAICLGTSSQLRAATDTVNRCWYFIASQRGDTLARCDHRPAFDVRKPHIRSRQVL